MNQIATQSPSAATCQPTSCLGLFGPPPNLEDRPDWRCIVAHQLAQEAQVPPTHDDPWIEALAEMLYVALQGKHDQLVPTSRQLNVHQAFQLQKLGGLVRKVLECRLAGEESIEEIASKSNASPGVIAAYEAIFCDLRDHNRHQAWCRMQLNPLQMSRGKVGTIMASLQRTFMFQGTDGVERVVDTLCRLEGPTMADGLPARDAPTFAEELSIRSDIALQLLPRNKKNDELMRRFEEACGSGPRTMMTDAAIDLTVEILDRVRVTKDLQKEIEQLRNFCQPQPKREHCAV